MTLRRLGFICALVGGTAAVALVGSGADTLAATDGSAAVSATARPLSTGVLDPFRLAGPDQASGYSHLRRTGARFVRMHATWGSIAPGGQTRPAGFDARNPADPRYQWAPFDREVTLAVRNGFTPVIYIQSAPQWAQGGTSSDPSDGPVRPSPAALADFATALATRYGGGFQSLPRVRYWQVWNEPNLDLFLGPQFENGKPASPELYRAMVNAMAGAVQAVRRDNVVISGGLSPFGGNSNDPSGGTHDQERIRPLEFMRELLCMSEGARPRPTCNQSTTFDIWAHHPYTYGGPTHSAFHDDDVSLGDLGKMKALLDAAKSAGHIKSRGAPQFWVTEFSYDSKPGDPKGLPTALHARWVSEALYRMWNNGVSHVTWFLIRDQPFPQEFFQSGLYMKNNKPKPALRAFRFPFVAFWKSNGAVSFWGRTPAGVKAAVVVEQQARGKWRRVAVPAVTRHGIFLGSVADPPSSGPLRARLASGKDFSQPFSLKVVKDFRFCPWGSFC